MLLYLSSSGSPHFLPCLKNVGENLIFYFVIPFTFVCLVYYGRNILLFRFSGTRKEEQKNPPDVPYVSILSGLGMVLGLLWSPREFVLSSRTLFWRTHPIRVTLLGYSFYILQGTKNISATLKQRHLSSFVLHGFLFRYLFNLPRSAAQTYHADDSGSYPTPDPDSVVEARNRVEFLTRNSVHRFLLGPGLTRLSERFQTDLAKRLQSLLLGSDWVTCENFLGLFQDKVASSALDALCGRYLLKQHTDFLENLWTLDCNVWKLICRLPRFLFPTPHSAREKALDALKDWHIWARENFDPASVDSNGDDPYWGTRFFRERQDMFRAMDGFDANAIASQELAFIWGALTNTIVTSFWTATEIFNNTNLLAAVRKEAQSCLLESQPEQGLLFDIDRLLQQPVLQAVYAETLRLRVNGFFIWHQSKDDMDIRGWRILKNHFVLTSPIPGHMDPAIWCAGDSQERDAHPVHEFFAGRWLKSFPAKGNANNGQPEVEFTTELSKGAWMPFGGGYHACPGRQFAKVMVLVSTAILVLLYDCEVLTDMREVKMSMRNFGFGTLEPVGKVAVRMRRRALYS